MSKPRVSPDLKARYRALTAALDLLARLEREVRGSFEPSPVAPESELVAAFALVLPYVNDRRREAAAAIADAVSAPKRRGKRRPTRSEAPSGLWEEGGVPGTPARP